MRFQLRIKIGLITRSLARLFCNKCFQLIRGLPPPQSIHPKSDRLLSGLSSVQTALQALQKKILIEENGKYLVHDEIIACWLQTL